MRHTLAAPSPRATGACQLLAWAGVLLIAALLGQAWSDGQAPMVMGLGIYLAACLGVLLLVGKLPAAMRLQLVLLAVLNSAGWSFGWYQDVGWFDAVAHSYAGFAGLAAIGYLYAHDRRRSRAHLVGWCAAMGLALGIGWEVIEAMMGPLGLVDTVSDLVLDTVGAALGGAFAWHALRRTRRAPG